jgi:hypothetical protein
VKSSGWTHHYVQPQAKIQTHFISYDSPFSRGNETLQRVLLPSNLMRYRVNEKVIIRSTDKIMKLYKRLDRLSNRVAPREEKLTNSSMVYSANTH